MTTPNPLRLPPAQRADLLTGPAVSLSLPQSSMPTPHIIPALPRRMLFAFSRLAASRLSVTDGIGVGLDVDIDATTPPASSRTITLPPDACTIGALEYLVLWMKTSCRSRSAVPIMPAARGAAAAQPDWRWVGHALEASRALEAPEAERQLQEWAKGQLARTPLGAAAFRAAVEGLEGADGGLGLVQACVRAAARFAAQGRLGEEEREGVERWLQAERPGLWELWEAFGERAGVGRELAVERRKVAVARLREKVRVENEMVAERMAGEAEERLERQRRLAGLIE